jgi:hypothetical protein
VDEFRRKTELICDELGRERTSSLGDIELHGMILRVDAQDLFLLPKTINRAQCARASLGRIQSV